MKRANLVLIALAVVATFAAAAEKPDTAGTQNGWLGVYTESLSEPMLVALDIDHGALVTEVAAESPAARAGFEVGDVIVSVAEAKVEGSSSLRRIVRDKPNRQVEILLRRRGKETRLTVKLGVREAVEHNLKFEWPMIPREAIRETRKALRQFGPEIREGLGHYDEAVDSLRKELDGLRRELNELREQVRKDRGR
jgi:membrane-associated protease RseP (regulator of RpoE activity)